MKNFIPFLIILLLFACKEENYSIQKCWALADRDDDVQVFYLCDDERLTRSWFRPSYKFYSNNKCEYLVLSPNDGHYYSDGIYEYDPESSILTVESIDGDLIVKFRILDLKENELKVEVMEGGH